MKVSVIEPAILLNAFAITLTIPLTAQYVYRRIWKESGNYSFDLQSNISECGQNKSSPIFHFQEVRNVKGPKMQSKGPGRQVAKERAVVPKAALSRVALHLVSVLVLSSFLLKP